MPAYMAQLAIEVAQSNAPWGDHIDDYRMHTPWIRFHEKLEGRNLYTFSRSAVSAAADIRISSARRLDAMIDALSQSDRSIFIEARSKDLNDHLCPLHEAIVPQRGDQDLYFSEDTIHRAGYFIDVVNREIRIEAYSLSSSEFSKSLFGNDYDSWPNKSLKRLTTAVRFASDGNVIIVKPIAHPIKEEAFYTRLALFGPPEGSPLAAGDYAASNSRERKRLMREAWWVQRYADMISEVDIDEEPLSTQSFPQLDPITTASIALCMLAALDAAGDGIEVSEMISTERRRPKKDKRPRSAVSSDNTLRLVTLNLNDKELEQAYEKPREQSNHVQGVGKNSGIGLRSRHPVRGHLFLARNGKITWRKPHWRGHLDKPSLTRVIKR